ncbi:3-hydroxyacyl-CoA dehydrogenase [Luteithermobacter gelatinilyticus]|uniref:3-hydroxyacyl-CoA dehydrogenase n=1 Tax=Luteithermobacter gelatinilyticus TaxID=2582913 RepID=UPI001105D7E3|nr:3-hydroxyacyl-CoA dehydrogenase [Luteithermobacter gelatinilyticus]|tara:strand:+ start:1961 stop:2725 length:765 start_codon:yes stop_codon:yes gene_type:complete
MDIKDMAAIVTGAASGLGEAVARDLAARGAKVSVFDLNREGGEQVAKDIGGKFFEVDVASEDSVIAALDQAAAAHGEARILVNCAGIAPAQKTVGRDNVPHDLALYKKVIEVNLIGSFNTLRLAAARMAGLKALEDGERGVIVNTASIAAFDGQIGQVAYASSKAAIAGMTLPIARDLSKLGIRICTIAPGIFGTPMLLGLPQEVQDSLGASVPFPSRLGKPEEYAALARHIIENRMLNGETIRLDGALRMAPK